MLHIITPLYRFELLEKVYNSILMNDDITWHISKSNKREDLNYEFIKNDKRIIVYNVDCEDKISTGKRNAALENIKSGYFCFLDDDTIFHENMYIQYQHCQERNFNGMLVGAQLFKDGTTRLNPSIPRPANIDTGNVLSHSSCLTKLRWVNVKTTFPLNDYHFWKSVYEFYNNKCDLTNTPISHYNKLTDR